MVYAPESGSPETLKLIKKKIKLNKMEESIKYAIKNNVSVRTNLIIGFRGKPLLLNGKLDSIKKKLIEKRKFDENYYYKYAISK